jgi:hypothetical protein
VDTRGVQSMDREARDLAGGDEVAAVTLRMALLVSNPLSELLGNFFLYVGRPKYRTRIFSSEIRAERWLREAVAGADLEPAKHD